MTIFKVMTIVGLIMPVVGIVVDIYLKRINHKWAKHGIGRLISAIIMVALFMAVMVLYSPNVESNDLFGLIFLSGARNAVIGVIATLVFAGLILVPLNLVGARFFQEKMKGKDMIFTKLFCVIVYSFLAITLTNFVFDSGETQTSFGTIERRVTSSSARSPNITRLIHVSIYGHDDEMRITVPRRFYNSVREGNMVYVCTRPGLWGFQWTSCVHRVGPDGRVHPDDDTPHLRGLR